MTTATEKRNKLFEIGIQKGGCVTLYGCLESTLHNIYFYHENQFHWWRKPTKSTELSQVIDNDVSSTPFHGWQSNLMSSLMIEYDYYSIMATTETNASHIY